MRYWPLGGNFENLSWAHLHCVLHQWPLNHSLYQNSFYGIVVLSWWSLQKWCLVCVGTTPAGTVPLVWCSGVCPGQMSRHGDVGLLQATWRCCAQHWILQKEKNAIYCWDKTPVMMLQIQSELLNTILNTTWRLWSLPTYSDVIHVPGRPPGGCLQTGKQTNIVYTCLADSACEARASNVEVKFVFFWKLCRVTLCFWAWAFLKINLKMEKRCIMHVHPKKQNKCNAFVLSRHSTHTHINKGTCQRQGRAASLGYLSLCI